jgi:hypothetical protein
MSIITPTTMIVSTSSDPRNVEALAARIWAA